MSTPIETTNPSSDTAAAWWAAQVADYLRLRRSLGFKLTWDEHLLSRFTAFLASR